MPLARPRLSNASVLSSHRGSRWSQGPGFAQTPLRAVIPTVLITSAMIAAVLLVIFLVPSAAAAPTQVYMDTENGRLVVTMQSVEVGERDSKDEDGQTTEQMTWTHLEPERGPQDTRDGAVLLAEGEARGSKYTELRLTFSQVEIARDHTMHALSLPQDTLQVQLPEPGQAGDSLLVVIDADNSVTEENGFLSFRPRIVDALWEPGGAENREPPVRAPVPTDPAGNPDPDTPPRPAPTTVQTDTGRTGGVDRPPSVGWFHVAFIGNGTGLVDTLDVTVSRIGLADENGDVTTVFDHERVAELVRAEDEGLAEVASMQIKPGIYQAIHFEFNHAEAGISGSDPQEAVIPQPRLVLEAPFEVVQAQAIGIVVEFGVEASLRLGLEGLEFRPVIMDYHTHDSEGRDITDPFPAQYRTDGSWLPSLGEVGDTLQEHDLDPDEVPHPIHGDKERDALSEGGLYETDPDDLERFLNDVDVGLDEATDPLPDDGLV